MRGGDAVVTGAENKQKEARESGGRIATRLFETEVALINAQEHIERLEWLVECLEAANWTYNNNADNEYAAVLAAARAAAYGRL